MTNTEKDKILRNNFFAAREIASTMAVNQMRRASAGEFEPFFGGNLNGQKVVLWRAKDQTLVEIFIRSGYGIIDLNGDIFHFRQVGWVAKDSNKTIDKVARNWYSNNADKARR